MKKKLLSLMVTTGSYQDFVNRIYNLAFNHRSSYVCVANVHMLVEAHNNARFANAVNNADIVTPDGMPLAKSFKLLHGIHQNRVAGMDLLPDLLQKAEANEVGVYFYGSTDEVLERTISYVHNLYPKLRIGGTFSPPFRPLNTIEEEMVIKDINSSGAGLVFVALGCPKQEAWMSSMKGKINACMVGIGGALPVMVGLQKRAPMWMQKACMEWVYRLAQEPKRLFKRYAVTNTAFIWLLMKSWIKIKLKTPPVQGAQDTIYEAV